MAAINGTHSYNITGLQVLAVVQLANRVGRWAFAYDFNHNTGNYRDARIAQLQARDYQDALNNLLDAIAREDKEQSGASDM